MKKILLATCVLSLIIGAKTFAADTYTGGLVESLNQKIDKVAAPVVNKEKELQEKQKAAQALQLKQVADKKQQLEARQKAQQELVNKKKQQIQTQKDLLKQQKNELKSLFQLNN